MSQKKENVGWLKTYQKKSCDLSFQSKQYPPPMRKELDNIQI